MDVLVASPHSPTIDSRSNQKKKKGSGRDGGAELATVWAPSAVRVTTTRWPTCSQAM